MEIISRWFLLILLLISLASARRRRKGSCSRELAFHRIASFSLTQLVMDPEMRRSVHAFYHVDS